MSFEYFPGVGMVHLQTVKKARVVPGHERHRWAHKNLKRGQTTSCDKCGCVRTYNRDFSTTYQPKGAQLPTEMRPPCTGVQNPTTSTATATLNL